MSIAGASFANQPQNPLFIDLQGKQSYAAGERVHGIVRVDPKIKPTHITIHFKGYSSIHNKNAAGVQVDFFKRSQDLFTSTGAGDHFDILKKGTAHDGKVELPFEFTFPRTVELPPPSDRTWHHSADSYNHPRFQHSPGFTLPPSSPPSAAVKDPLTPRIVYFLEARMESSLPDGPSRIRQEVQFIPPAPDYQHTLLEPDLNFGTTLPKHLCKYKLIRTRKLYPNYRLQSKGSRLKDKLYDKEMFFGLERSGEIPYARFNYFATPARVLIRGTHVPITMTVQQLERSESLLEPPIIFIRRVRVQLLHTFNIFVPNLHTAKNHYKETIDTMQESTQLMDKRFEKSEGRLLIDGLKLSDFGDLTIPLTLLPSFTSYGLALEYEIQVDLWCECAEREFWGLACKEKVQLVPDYLVAAPPPGIDEFYGHAPGPEYQELDPMNAVHELSDARGTAELPATNPFSDAWRPGAAVDSRAAVPPPSYEQVR